MLTFDHEHVPTELLEKLVADGVAVAPPPEALVHAQDKLVMRQLDAAAAKGNTRSAEGYVRNWQRFKAGLLPVWIKSSEIVLKRVVLVSAQR